MILRTPLHAIKTAATSVTSDEVSWSPEEIREFSMTIDSETGRLTALVDAMGGDLALEDTPRRRATFVFTLQLAARRVPGASPQRHTGNPAPQPLTGGSE